MGRPYLVRARARIEISVQIRCSAVWSATPGAVNLLQVDDDDESDVDEDEMDAINAAAGATGNAAAPVEQPDAAGKPAEAKAKTVRMADPGTTGTTVYRNLMCMDVHALCYCMHGCMQTTRTVIAVCRLIHDPDQTYGWPSGSMSVS